MDTSEMMARLNYARGLLGPGHYAEEDEFRLPGADEPDEPPQEARGGDFPQESDFVPPAAGSPHGGAVPRIQGAEFEPYPDDQYPPDGGEPAQEPEPEYGPDPEEGGFRAALNDLNDRTARAVYADWLDEHGRPREAARFRMMGAAEAAYADLLTNPAAVPHGRALDDAAYSLNTQGDRRVVGLILARPLLQYLTMSGIGEEAGAVLHRYVRELEDATAAGTLEYEVMPSLPEVERLVEEWGQARRSPSATPQQRADLDAFVAGVRTLMAATNADLPWLRETAAHAGRMIAMSRLVRRNGGVQPGMDQYQQVWRAADAEARGWDQATDAAVFAAAQAKRNAEAGGAYYARTRYAEEVTVSNGEYEPKDEDAPPVTPVDPHAPVEPYPDDQYEPAEFPLPAAPHVQGTEPLTPADAATDTDEYSPGVDDGELLARAALADPIDNVGRLALADYYEENDREHEADRVRWGVTLVNNGESNARKLAALGPPTVDAVHGMQQVVQNYPEWTQRLVAVGVCRGLPWDAMPPRTAADIAAALAQAEASAYAPGREDDGNLRRQEAAARESRRLEETIRGDETLTPLERAVALTSARAVRCCYGTYGGRLPDYSGLLIDVEHALFHATSGYVAGDNWEGDEEDLHQALSDARNTAAERFLGYAWAITADTPPQEGASRRRHYRRQETTSVDYARKRQYRKVSLDDMIDSCIDMKHRLTEAMPSQYGVLAANYDDMGDMGGMGDAGGMPMDYCPAFMGHPTGEVPFVPGPTPEAARFGYVSGPDDRYGWGQQPPQDYGVLAANFAGNIPSPYAEEDEFRLPGADEPDDQYEPEGGDGWIRPEASSEAAPRPTQPEPPPAPPHIQGAETGEYTPGDPADAFRAAIDIDPADEIAQLVYADWLDEHGEPERAANYRRNAAGLAAARNVMEQTANEDIDHHDVDTALLALTRAPSEARNLFSISVLRAGYDFTPPTPELISQPGPARVGEEGLDVYHRLAGMLRDYVLHKGGYTGEMHNTIAAADRAATQIAMTYSGMPHDADFYRLLQIGNLLYAALAAARGDPENAAHYSSYAAVDGRSAAAGGYAPAYETAAVFRRAVYALATGFARAGQQQYTVPGRSAEYADDDAAEGMDDVGSESAPKSDTTERRDEGHTAPVPGPRPTGGGSAPASPTSPAAPAAPTTRIQGRPAQQPGGQQPPWWDLNKIRGSYPLQVGGTATPQPQQPQPQPPPNRFKPAKPIAPVGAMPNPDRGWEPVPREEQGIRPVWAQDAAGNWIQVPPERQRPKGVIDPRSNQPEPPTDDEGAQVDPEVFDDASSAARATDWSARTSRAAGREAMSAIATAPEWARRAAAVDSVEGAMRAFGIHSTSDDNPVARALSAAREYAAGRGDERTLAAAHEAAARQYKLLMTMATRPDVAADPARATRLRLMAGAAALAFAASAPTGRGDPMRNVIKMLLTKFDMQKGTNLLRVVSSGVAQTARAYADRAGTRGRARALMGYARSDDPLLEGCGRMSEMLAACYADDDDTFSLADLGDDEPSLDLDVGDSDTAPANDSSRPPLSAPRVYPHHVQGEEGGFVPHPDDQYGPTDAATYPEADIHPGEGEWQGGGDETALWHAVEENRDENMTRLALADYYDENGRPEAAHRLRFGVDGRIRGYDLIENGPPHTRPEAEVEAAMRETASLPQWARQQLGTEMTAQMMRLVPLQGAAKPFAAPLQGIIGMLDRAAGGHGGEAEIRDRIRSIGDAISDAIRATPDLVQDAELMQTRFVLFGLANALNGYTYDPPGMLGAIQGLAANSAEARAARHVARLVAQNPALEGDPALEDYRTRTMQGYWAQTSDELTHAFDALTRGFLQAHQASGGTGYAAGWRPGTRYADDWDDDDYGVTRQPAQNPQPQMAPPPQGAPAEGPPPITIQRYDVTETCDPPYTDWNLPPRPGPGSGVVEVDAAPGGFLEGLLASLSGLMGALGGTSYAAEDEFRLPGADEPDEPMPDIHEPDFAPHDPDQYPDTGSPQPRAEMPSEVRVQGQEGTTPAPTYATNTELAGFRDAVQRNPDDDTTRLVYADWLEEHDQPERAAEVRAATTTATRLRGLTTVSPNWSGNAIGDEVAYLADGAVPPWAVNTFRTELFKTMTRLFNLPTTDLEVNAVRAAELVNLGLADPELLGAYVGDLTDSLMEAEMDGNTVRSQVVAAALHALGVDLEEEGLAGFDLGDLSQPAEALAGAYVYGPTGTGDEVADWNRTRNAVRAVVGAVWNAAHRPAGYAASGRATRYAPEDEFDLVNPEERDEPVDPYPDDQYEPPFGSDVSGDHGPLTPADAAPPDVHVQGEEPAAGTTHLDTEGQLRAAVEDNPGDDVVKLALADYLDEADRPEEAYRLRLAIDGPVNAPQPVPIGDAQFRATVAAMDTRMPNPAKQVIAADIAALAVAAVADAGTMPAYQVQFNYAARMVRDAVQGLGDPSLAAEYAGALTTAAYRDYTAAASGAHADDLVATVTAHRLGMALVNAMAAEPSLAAVVFAASQGVRANNDYTEEVEFALWRARAAALLAGYAQAAQRRPAPYRKPSGPARYAPEDEFRLPGADDPDDAPQDAAGDGMPDIRPEPEFEPYPDDQYQDTAPPEIHVQGAEAQPQEEQIVLDMDATSDEAGFHDAMEREPQEDTHRMVYADWLDEHGRPLEAGRLRYTTDARAEARRRAPQQGAMNPEAVIPGVMNHLNYLNELPGWAHAGYGAEMIHAALPLVGAVMPEVAAQLRRYAGVLDELSLTANAPLGDQELIALGGPSEAEAHVSDVVNPVVGQLYDLETRLANLPIEGGGDTEREINALPRDAAVSMVQALREFYEGRPADAWYHLLDAVAFNARYHDWSTSGAPVSAAQWRESRDLESAAIFPLAQYASALADQYWLQYQRMAAGQYARGKAQAHYAGQADGWPDARAGQRISPDPGPPDIRWAGTEYDCTRMSAMLAACAP